MYEHEPKSVCFHNFSQPHGELNTNIKDFTAPRTFRNYTDGDGNPAGGTAASKGMDIRWQDGPMPTRADHNGAFICTVIVAVMQRLAFFQASEFACEENDEAGQHLEKALDALKSRRARRADAGTLGTNQGA